MFVQAAQPGPFKFYVKNPDGSLTMQYGLPPAGYVDISQPALPMATSMVVKTAARARTLPPASVTSMGPGGVCIAGEALIDMLPRTTAEGAAAFQPCPGGAPFNALLAAVRLGMKTSYLASLSSDMFGEQLYGLLEEAGVKLDLVTRVDLPTTLAFVTRTPQGERYAFFKENAADRAVTSKRVREVLQSNRFDAVHMSLGAVTFEDTQMKEAYDTLFELAGRQGSLRSFDPNLRSNMIKGSPQSYRKKMEDFLTKVDIAKASDDDIAFLYGEEVDFRDVAAEWLKMGPGLVVVTAGSKGATVFYPGGEPFSVEPPGERPDTIDASGAAAPVADTVGAGDTFMGSLISGILSSADTYQWMGKDAPLLETLFSREWTEDSEVHLRCVVERAAVCAAINVSRAGCNPPTSEEAAAAGKALGLSFAQNV